MGFMDGIKFQKYNQLTRAEKNLLDEMAEILSSGNIKIEDLNLLIENCLKII